jgi:hypothetical protein
MNVNNILRRFDLIAEAMNGIDKNYLLLIFAKKLRTDKMEFTVP